MSRRKRKISKQESRAFELSIEIEKAYSKFNVKIDIVDWDYQGKRIRYTTKLKSSSTVDHVTKYAQDVKFKLGLQSFHAYVESTTMYIVVSEHELKYPRLLKVLGNNTCEEMYEMELPYIVGHNAMGELITVDVAEFPHILVGGSTNSGKSVALQVLITSIACTKTPSGVNFIMIDVGVGDLIPFDGIPHLSYPVIQDLETAYKALIVLKDEMDRRLELKKADYGKIETISDLGKLPTLDDPIDFDDPIWNTINTAKYEELPRLVLVIDEFPALIAGISDKDMLRQITNAISSLLQRGRHAKIHLVLAAQNPTIPNMKVDLGNIPARIAFKCAKKNYSETILGERGAEDLVDKGSLLLKSPQNNIPQWIQGIYIKPTEIQQVIQKLKSCSRQYSMEHKFALTIPENPPAESKSESYLCLPPVTVAAGPSEQDRQFAGVMFWAFGQAEISTNRLMKDYHIGWNKANSLVKRLEKLGIVDEPNGKQPRCIRPKSIEDIPEEMAAFMERCGYPPKALICAFQERTRCQHWG